VVIAVHLFFLKPKQYVILFEEILQQHSKKTFMYIHQSVCISPQHTLSDSTFETIVASADNKLLVIEPKYESIPLNALRRMGKAVRLGVGAASIVLKDNPTLNGIILGTANGGMEDCIKFLNQIIDFDEGTLTPTNFVQSTTNAVAAQIGLTTKNKNYNITHVHRGLAFENALLDALMLLLENINANYLVGGVDEISGYNFNLENLAGSYKKELVSNFDLFNSKSEGSIAGEAAVMFIVNDNKEGAIAKVNAIGMIHTLEEQEVTASLKLFLEENLKVNQEVDLFLSGENGDSRTAHFYTSCEALFSKTTIARFKHLCGEFPAASAFALWLSCSILKKQNVPTSIIKKNEERKAINTILIYNNYKGLQHSFILVER